MKTNCWDFMVCGRGPEGERVAELGSCPAATNVSSDGLNGGRNAGRYCWHVAGSSCRENPAGTWGALMLNCATCEFYRSVEKEEGSRFTV